MSSLRAFTQASLHNQLVLTPCSNNPFVVDFVGYSPNVERDELHSNLTRWARGMT